MDQERHPSRVAAIAHGFESVGHWLLSDRRRKLLDLLAQQLAEQVDLFDGESLTRRQRRSTRTPLLDPLAENLDLIRRQLVSSRRIEQTETPCLFCHIR